MNAASDEAMERLEVRHLPKALTFMSGQRKPPMVAIVIVNWNGYEDTIGCLESLRWVTYSNYCVIVVDNASSDGSERRIRERYPEHTVLQSGSNRGFAGGSNVGIRSAVENGSDYVLLLNNDTRVDRLLIENLVRTGESNMQIGLTGATIEYMSSPGKVWACGAAFNVNTGQAKHFLHETEFQSFQPVKGWRLYIPACSVLIKRECLEDVGLLSEKFFHLAEDVEFCLRAQRKGWRLALASNALLLHKGSASLARFSPLYNYYEQRNRLFVIQQYRMERKSVCLNVKDALIILARLTLILARVESSSHLVRSAWLLILAVYDFLGGRDGQRENDFADHTVPPVSQRRPCRRQGDL